MVKKFLPASISVFCISCFFVLFISSQTWGSHDQDLCLKKRTDAVTQQVKTHALCNDMTGKTTGNSFQAIKELEALLKETGNTDLLSEIPILKSINKEGNEAKHKWTEDYCSAAGKSSSPQQARQTKSGQSISSIREQRWAPMRAATNTSYGGNGQNLSALGSAVMGPPPPTPYEQSLRRATVDGTATIDDLKRLGIGTGRPLSLISSEPKIPLRGCNHDDSNRYIPWYEGRTDVKPTPGVKIVYLSDGRSVPSDAVPAWASRTYATREETPGYKQNNPR